MNRPIESKINWTAAAMQVVTILMIAGVIPVQYEEPILALVGIVLPGMIQIFRTWFTESSDAG